MDLKIVSGNNHRSTLLSMARPSTGKTTESSRRHAFQSFRERIDSIRIDPNLDLSTRAFDHVESSHFQTTLEHWREINISGNFTEFLDKVEIYSQSLPQILHHKVLIFNALYDHIKVKDIYSIQPLLELLAQFVHDLGDDFMEFYPNALGLLVEVALDTNPNDEQNSRNSSNQLQWVFNCLAFIFKYLVKTLIKDLLPTFETLYSLLTLHKKTYVSRFCVEALSYLIRKSKLEDLTTIIKFTLNDDIINNDEYCESLATLYSEATISTKGNFHSKAKLVLLKLLEVTFEMNPGEIQIKAISIIADILLDVVNHGTVETCSKYYELVIEFLVQAMENEGSLLPVSQLLTSMSFAESGKRVSSWTALISATTLLVEKTAKISASRELLESATYLLIILFRNCDTNILTKQHMVIFDASRRTGDGRLFLSFADACLENFGDKVINFGIGKYIQEYIYHIAEEIELKQLALFITRFNNHRKVVLPRLSIGYNHQTKIMSQLDNLNIHENLHDVYWRLLLLINGGDESAEDSSVLVNILEDILSDKRKLESQLSHDIVSIALSSLTSTLNAAGNEVIIQSLYEKLVFKLAILQESSIFVKSFSGYICKFGLILKDQLRKDKVQILKTIVENLYLPSQDSRTNAIQLMIGIFKILGDEVPSFLTQISIIEQMPRNFSTGRDIQLRIRNLGIEVKSEADSLSSFDYIIISNYLIGLLTNKFQPSWEAALEVLPEIQSKCSDNLWRLCYEFMVFDYESQNNTYGTSNAESFTELESSLVEWQPRSSKLKDNFIHMEEHTLGKYRNIDTSLTNYAINSRADNTHSSFMRLQVIKALAVMSSLGEANSKQLLSLVFSKVSDLELDDENFEDDTGISTQNWNLTDRNGLLKLFGKFKNLKKIHNSKRLYDHLLMLLSSKKLAVQKMSLDVILNWGVSSINKYRDNLKNLLDETLFREEISKFITDGTDSTIEDKDLEILMPLVLRILFGRAQGTPKSNSKAGRKFAVLSILPLLKDSEIISFLQIGSDKLGFNKIEEVKSERINSSKLKRISGYVNLLGEVYITLGPKHSSVLATTIEPLLYSLITSQQVIDTINESPDTTVIDGKTARTIRQLGMKCLSDLFVSLGEDFNWKENDRTITIYESILKPRLPNFANENSQQVSSLMKIMLNFIDYKNTYELLYIDDFAPAKAIISLLGNFNIKDEVSMAVLDFSYKALNVKDIIDDRYFVLLALLVNSLLLNLPTLIENISNKELGSFAIKVLLKLIYGGYVNEQDTKASLIKSLTIALDKPPSCIDSKDKVNMLLSLSAIIDGYDCSFADITPLYQACAKAFRMFVDPKIRESIVLVFVSIGEKFAEVKQVAEILTEINANSQKRMQEMDFERRLNGFKRVNEELYTTLTPIQWLPLIYCALFFINDEEELVIRSSSAYLLNRFVDSYSAKKSMDLAKPYISELKNVVLPYLRIGLRKRNEEVRSEYIGVLGHIVENSKFFEDFKDMKVLNKNDDEEMSFFANITHIQLHRRQRAIRRLVDHRNELNENNISHYLLPIIEHYAISDDEKHNNIAVEAYDATSNLVRCLGWNHFKALLKRYISNLKAQKSDLLKNYVKLLVACSKAFMVAHNLKIEGKGQDVIKKMPNDSAVLDDYILKEVFPPILRILVIRNDDTIVARTPLAEALSCFLSCMSEEKIESELPGILTSTCQVMRSRSEELREAVRKTLSRIVKLLGPKYLVFILRELKTALSRGSQIHVLSYTVHYLLAFLKDRLKHGELNEAVEIIVEIMMEDIFGAAGQEKDAEGYHSKMKEVKYKKSFDSGEIISANVSLGSFTYLLKPIKLLLSENLSLKVQNKVDELLRRYSMGLNHNEQAGDPEILSLSYEIIEQTTQNMNGKVEVKNDPKKNLQEHFLVKLDKKSNKMHYNNLGYIHTLQRFSFEVLRTVTTKHDELRTVERLVGFVPFLEEGLNSENEGVVISCLKVLNSIIRLDFSGEEDILFKTCARKSLSIIKDSPTTNSELCQAALRFLATAIRHKPDVQVKPSAISYILLRIQPDLEEPNKQGLAFNFVKSVISQHIMIPEIYDVIDRVAKIMVVNHAKEIRDMSRSVYYLFLMEYDQGRGRLEKQFKFLVSNLAYPTEEGRQSVMELLHQIILKSGAELVSKLASSFFIALANVIVTDDSPRCKEMSSTLIGNIFKILGREKLSSIEKYISAWLLQDRNFLLKRCGLNIYKIYVLQFGVGANLELDEIAFENVEKLIASARNDHNQDEVLWELLYSALTVFSTICQKLKDGAFEKRYEGLWKSVVDVLLFPHAWIRLLSSRLIANLLVNLDKIQFPMSNYEIQTIAYRLLRQLSAPSITEELAGQIIKNLVLLGMRWESQKTLFESKELAENDETGHIYAGDYLVAKTCAIMRLDGQNSSSLVSKTAAIKLGAMITQFLEMERLESMAEKFMLALYNFTENQDSELYNLAQESKQMIENKLGVTVYTQIYAKVKSIVNLRRQERKTKRSQMAVNAPDLAAKRKLRKHERSREKRKHEKDDNGYYKTKRRHN